MNIKTFNTLNFKTLVAVCAGLCSSLVTAADENKVAVLASATQIDQLLDSSKMGSKLKLKISSFRTIGIAKDEELFDVYVILSNINTGSSVTNSNQVQDKFLKSFSHKGNNFKDLIRYENIPVVRAQLSLSQLEELSLNTDVQRINIKKNYRKFDADGHALTDVDLAQNAGFSGAGVTIAIIDDGIDYAHAAFGGSASFPNSKILGGYDFADNDTNPVNDCDGQSHGTAVTGVAIGNGGGVNGVAPNAKAVMLKVQSNSAGCNANSLNYGYLDGDIVGAIDWAVSNRNTYGIKLISMSLGGGEWSSEASCDADNSADYLAVQAANNVGITVLAASGNDGLCSSMGAPACLSNVVSVGAVYDADVGNYGTCISPNTCVSGTQQHATCAAVGLVAYFEDGFSDKVTAYSNSASFLDITAPATCAETALAGGGTNDCFGGTSSATPFTSGVAALAIEASDSSLSPTQLRSALTSSGESNTDPKNNRNTPRVNALNIVNQVGTVIPCTDNCDTHFENTTVSSIPDNNTSGINSSIDVSRSGLAGTINVTVNITHTWKGDLRVTLTTPSGIVHSLHNNTGSSTDNIHQTYTLDTSNEAAAGTWTLFVSDNARRDTGTLDNWSIDF